MNVIDDNEIDFDAYLNGPSEDANVRPASSWLEDVLEAFRTPPTQHGASFPWAKTHEIARLRRGELSIWPGMSGHGKSILSGQVMLGLMAQGERVCIASMEMKPAETMQRMCRQALGCNTPSVRDIKDFHRWTDGKLWLYDQRNAVTPERILAVARYAHSELSVGHVVIDNLMTCGIAEDGDGWQSRQKQFILDLSCHAHDTRQSVHLLAHVRKQPDESRPPSKFDVRGSASITDLADNVLTVWRNKPKEADRESGGNAKSDEADCLLIIDKCRHGNWEGRIQLWFDRESQSYLEQQGEQPRAMRFGDDMEVDF
jgi:twinkle protein